MDYKAIWNEICFYVNKNRGASERDFQTTIEFMFEKLGWSQYKGEIVSQKVIPVGAANSVKPDIIIKDNDKMVLVVELKKPNTVMSERNAEQLKSYMRLLKLEFGILLGDTLQLYCELPNDDGLPVRINDIPFTNDSDDGAECIKLLSKLEYSTDKLRQYYASCLEATKQHGQAKQHIELLCSSKGAEIVAGLLTNNLALNFSKEQIAMIMDEISIHISRKGVGIVEPLLHTQIKSEAGAITASERMEFIRRSANNFVLEFNPSDERVFKERLLQTKRAKRTWFYTDGRTETDIWDASKFTTTSNLNGNIYSNNKVRQRDKIGLIKLK
ncbi:MAG: type I restriction enzyme HsdR N-terminal domain-containing protein, partial [Oscillospiraceae bacterium]|nr:type I restriction enzyme HsdR N-terminal domain-containing protein [Oscillospiraceae bacterium]